MTTLAIYLITLKKKMNLPILLDKLHMTNEDLLQTKTDF